MLCGWEWTVSLLSLCIMCASIKAFCFLLWLWIKEKWVFHFIRKMGWETLEVSPVASFLFHYNYMMPQRLYIVHEFLLYCFLSRSSSSPPLFGVGGGVEWWGWGWGWGMAVGWYLFGRVNVRLGDRLRLLMVRSSLSSPTVFTSYVLGFCKEMVDPYCAAK